MNVSTCFDAILRIEQHSPARHAPEEEKIMAHKPGEPKIQVQVTLATPEQQPILANLLELYVHDFSEFHPVALGPDGRFGYKGLEEYWSAPDRYAFLFTVDGNLAGLALIKKGSEITRDPSFWDVREF